MQGLRKTGESYRFETISSSTVGSNPAFDKQLHIHIKSKTGVHVAPISSHKNENEVLFGTEQKFEVTECYIKDGKYHVKIEEL